MTSLPFTFPAPVSAIPMRKTIDLVTLHKHHRAQSTRRLPDEWSDDMKRGFLSGLNVSLDVALTKAGAYAGYHYINEDGSFNEDSPEVGTVAHARRRYVIHWSLEDDFEKEPSVWQ